MTTSHNQEMINEKERSAAQAEAAGAAVMAAVAVCIPVAALSGDMGLGQPLAYTASGIGAAAASGFGIFAVNQLRRSRSSR